MSAFVRRIREKLGKAVEALPPELAAGIEFHSNSRGYFYPWGSAMNGQTARLEVCRRCLTELAIEVVVETGTYRGVTTEWLAGFEMPVHSIEIEPRFHHFARHRLRHHPNVTLHLGDSPGVIGGELGASLEGRSVFAYLDAHWREHLPLKEEITALANLARDFVVLIDDFEVPGDPGYVFDDYGPVGACTLDFIAPALTPDVAVYHPTTPSRNETGQRTGYVVLARGARPIGFLERLDLLARSSTHLHRPEAPAP